MDKGKYTLGRRAEWKCEFKLLHWKASNRTVILEMEVEKLEDFPLAPAYNDAFQFSLMWICTRVSCVIP